MNSGLKKSMISSPVALRALPKHPSVWKFKTLESLSHRIIQRPVCLILPQEELTLTMSANSAVRKDLLHFLNAARRAA